MEKKYLWAKILFSFYLVANYVSTPVMLDSILCFLEKSKCVCMIILFFSLGVLSQTWRGRGGLIFK